MLFISKFHPHDIIEILSYSYKIIIEPSSTYTHILFSETLVTDQKNILYSDSSRIYLHSEVLSSIT